MSGSSFRPLSCSEREVLEVLLAPDFPGKDELVHQIEHCQVKVIDENGSLDFDVTDTVKATHVKYAVPTEGEYEDSDGVMTHVLLHVAGDYITMLDIYKENLSRVIQLDPKKLRVFAYS